MGRRFSGSSYNSKNLNSEFDPTETLLDAVDITITEKEKDAEIKNILNKNLKERNH